MIFVVYKRLIDLYFDNLFRVTGYISPVLGFLIVNFKVKLGNGMHLY
ncbi:hypothetical protein GCM10008018_65800 [Paenibacillus marchantiophytorum]|uniref:Uncharacterized protein n=1 Tax=Paenibacillus marchantiophytorum TaxID=1619310 RepID=A0ABQ1FHY6_9BACL|nr:hypothetical protein GCM10008018_65800 [Paenibacillus marchantiophytorum]